MGASSQINTRRLCIGQMECGYEMSKPSLITHAVGFLVMSMSMLFSYAVLMENGAATAMVGFVFGFGFLMLVYGHELDRVYFHVGNKVKFGADAYEPDREQESAFIEVEDDDNRYR